MTDEEILEANKANRQECEVYTRIMGYFRPVSQYNKGKQSEYNERVWFTEEQILKHEKEEKVA